MFTSVVIEKVYKGVKLHACGTKGCKYTVAKQMEDGSQWFCGCKTIKDADELFESKPGIRKMVVYVWHTKKKVFEVCRYYER